MEILRNALPAKFMNFTGKAIKAGQQKG